ncbi:hypothetical protein C8R43DRAFT_1131025 [Mycena crocata]|nr:hypothetical protein C8R43DRAFT_1131025 [Mycena crocata]
MHDSLRLQNLRALPMSIRSYATRAAAGSVSDMEKVMTRIGNHPQDSAHFLPVTFARLDLALIPCSDSLDTNNPSPELVTTFSLALRALASMGLIRAIPYAAFVDLWPRSWAWIELIEMYPWALAPAQSVEAIRPQIVVCMFRMMLDPRSVTLIHDTPGITAFVARTWTSMTAGKYDEFTYAAWFALSGFMRTSPWNEAKLKEFIEGCDMDAPAFAARLVDDIRLNDLTSSLEPAMLEMQCSCLAGVLRFALSCEDSQFLNTLLSAGMAEVVSNALVSLGRCKVCAAEGAIVNALHFLTIAICTGHEYSCLRGAAKAGLLRGILALGNRERPSLGSRQQMERLLHQVLPGALMHHLAVSGLASEIPDLCPISDARFINSPLYPHWTKLVKLLKDRNQVLEYCHSEEYIRWRICDECNVLKSAPDIRRCIACKAQNYCSVACQTGAWRSVHSEECVGLQEDDPSLPVGRTLRKGTERFARVVVHRDYQVRKLEILLFQLDFMHRWPGTPFTTVFDYTMGLPQIDVISLPDVENTGSLTSLPLKFETGLHHVRLAVGDDGVFSRNYILRSTSTALADGLRGIARRLPKDANVAQLEVQHPHFYSEVKDLSELKIGETHG